MQAHEQIYKSISGFSDKRNFSAQRKGKDMSMKSYIDEAESALLHTYNRYPVVLDKGDGVYLYDIEGKRYLDFVSGIGVFALGYHNEEYNDALKAQIDKLLHTSNYYYNVPAIEAAKKLKEISGMDRVFLQIPAQRPPRA